MYWIEYGRLQEWVLSCVRRRKATQHSSLLSVVLRMSNPEALTSTPCFMPLSLSNPSPLPTLVSCSPCLPDEQSVPPGASVHQMSSIIMLLQMSEAGLLALCVFLGVVHIVWGNRAYCAAATAFPPSLSVIQCINV